MKRGDPKVLLFLFGVLAITLGATFLVWRSLVITRDTWLVSAVWVGGFGFLFFNVVYLFLLSIIHLFVKRPVLEEAFVKNYPKIALVYPIRNEEHGLFERIDYSLSGNRLPNLDLWILSDSGHEYSKMEEEIVCRLHEKYGSRIHYRRRREPVERKQGNIKEFLNSHPEYSYIYVADADGMVPRGVILKLLRKAEHPENQDIAIFQAFTRIAHANTWYGRFERIGAEFAQKLNFSTIQAFFGRSISFGHHQLVRTGIFSKVQIPKGILSHDNWDTVLLDQMGYRVAFCPDVIAYDEAPSNYLEARARVRRWARGTLQGWPLIFKQGITLASRFLAFYGVYLYIADIVFLAWVILGLLAHSFPLGELFHIEVNSIWMGEFTNAALKWILLFTLAVVFGHKLAVIRSLRDFAAYLYEIFFSTLVNLNNALYVPFYILVFPFRKLKWKPMSKNPFETVSFRDCAKGLWFGTLIGIGGFYFITHETPHFVWQILPFLLCFILSVPLVYLSSKPMPERIRAWI